MATVLEIQLRAQNQASRELLKLRGTVGQLNKVIAEQRNSLIGANAEEQKSIRAHIQANQALKAHIRTIQDEVQLRKSRAAQVAREARQEEQSLRRLSIARRDAIQAITAGLAPVAQQLRRVTANVIGIAASFETYQATLQAATGDTKEANRILAELLAVTVDLVGIDTGDLVNFTGRLIAAGAGADEALTAVKGLTEATAEQGKSSASTRLQLNQYAQALTSGRILAQDMNTIIREQPRFFEAASIAVGETVESLDEFREAAERTGNVRQVILDLGAAFDQISTGADLDTLNAQLEVLEDNTANLARELGEHLLPAAVAIVKGINDLIQDFIALDDRIQKAIAFSGALAAVLTTLLTIIGSLTIALGALSAAVKTLIGTSALGGLSKILPAITSGLSKLVTVGGLATTAVITLSEAWRQIYDDFQSGGSLFEDGIPLEQIHRLGDTSDELELIKSRLAEIRQEYARFNSEGNAEAVAQLSQEYQTLLERLQSLRQQSQSVAILPTIEVQAKSLAEQIVVVDFEIRKLEQSLAQATAPEQILSNSVKIQRALEKEADLFRERAEKIKDADERQVELTRIGLQLELDKARIQDQAGKAIIKVNNEINKSYQEQLKTLQDLGHEASRRQRAIGRYFGQSIANLRGQAHEGRLAAEAMAEFQRNVDLLNASLERSIETRRQIAEQRREEASIARLESGESDRAQREEDAFSDIIPGGPTPLDNLRQKSAQEGSDFILELYRKQSEELEKELEGQYRSYQRFGNRVSSVLASSLGDLLRGQEINLKEILISFIQTYTRIILQETFRAQIQKRIDDEVTNHKLANLERLESANQGSVANLLRSNGYGSGLSGIGSIVSLVNPAAGTAISIAGSIVSALGNNNAPNAPSSARPIVLEMDSKEVARTLINGESEGRYRLSTGR